MDFAHPVEALIPGAPGRLLAALARVDTELPVSRLAVVAGVGRTRASVVLSDLAQLGVVTRRQVGPTTLVRLDRENVAGGLVAQLGSAWRHVVERMRELARAIDPQPVSLVVFGSFARGAADAASDIDLLAIRPDPPVADSWPGNLTRFSSQIEAITGNSVHILDYGMSDLRERYASRSDEAGGSFWRSVTEDAVLLAGLSLAELMGADHDARRKAPQGE